MPHWRGLRNNQHFALIWALKRPQSTEKRQICRDNRRFSAISNHALSYQPRAIPRIVRRRRCRFAGTGGPFLFFDPAETT